MYNRIVKHNPHCKLVEKNFSLIDKNIKLVYSINNDNISNEGLEVYYHKPNELGHYRSYRWNHDSVPVKYFEVYSELQDQSLNVPKGHKLIIQ